MNASRQRLLTHGLALVVGATAAFLWTARDRGDLEQLRAEAQSWGEATERATTLERDFAQLRSQYEELASRMPKPNELAGLRANAAELQRVRQELAEARAAANRPRQPSAPLTAPTAKEPLQPEVEPTPTAPFTMTGTIDLGFGDTVITGGWQLEPGQRGFVLATPALQEDGTILMEAKLLAIPEVAISNAGLTELLSASRHSERYGVTNPEETQTLLSSLEGMPGVEILTGPRMVTSANTEAELSVLKGAPGEGIVLKFNPRLRPDGTSLDLEMNVQLTAPPGQ